MSLPREGSRDTGEGIVVSIHPDVCLTPVGNAMVPVPYTLWARQEDDANTEPTVRMTGLRTRNMGSLITTCHGDEAGTGGGVESGTHNGICEPKGHSRNVFAEGKEMLRHTDEWWMNNRNTVGKLMYVKDAGKYGRWWSEQTGRVQLAQAAQLRSPRAVETEPAPIYEIPPYQILAYQPRGPAANDNFTGRPGPLQVPGAPLNVPSYPTIVPPGFPSPGDAPMPNWTPAPNPQLIPLAPPAELIDPNSKQLRLPYCLQPYNYKFNGSTGVNYGLDGNYHIVTDLPAPMDKVMFQPSVNGYFPNIPADGSWNQWFFGTLSSGAEMAAICQELAKRQRQELKPDESVVRTTGREQRRPCPCIVGTYKSIKAACSEANCNGQAHHIVPDYTLRYGTRKEGMAKQNRIDKMPSFDDGAAICLEGGAKDDGREHWEAHGGDGLIEALGATNTPVGTAPIGKIVLASSAQISAMKAGDAACVARMNAQVVATFGGVKPNALGRTTQMPPTLGSPAYKALSGRPPGTAN